MKISDIIIDPEERTLALLTYTFTDSVYKIYYAFKKDSNSFRIPAFSYIPFNERRDIVILLSGFQKTVRPRPPPDDYPQIYYILSGLVDWLSAKP